MAPATQKNEEEHPQMSVRVGMRVGSNGPLGVGCLTDSQQLLQTGVFGSIK